MVVVERESRARQLGHRIYGRILAVRTNHNGKGKPILVPRVRAQEQIIRKTLDAAGIDPADVGMIEGHGTATLAGDPVELLALFKTYGAAGSEALLGSIKSNAGHAQAAAGILGLIKLLLAGQRGHIPPTLFADNPNKLDWDRPAYDLPRNYVEPKDGGALGLASSFGAGGADARSHRVRGPGVASDYSNCRLTYRLPNGNSVLLSSDTPYSLRDGPLLSYAADHPEALAQGRRNAVSDPHRPPAPSPGHGG
jgi:3-oxoacyl-(acyl-carrier-protein) synthase